MIQVCQPFQDLPINNQKTMFTVEQIQLAHSKVKSGADFPAYVREIRAMGVTRYEAYVSDGHIDYHGVNKHTVTMPAKYAPLVIAGISNSEAFKKELVAHQQGKTDFLTFIRMCASVGIEKWVINMDRMTCTYYDKAGNEMLAEDIPQ
jgi:uncharacterized protein YbcV (DUF1398 family)